MNAVLRLKGLSNPVFGVALFLLPSLFFFSDFQYWWLYQLITQITLCMIGLFIAGWRLFSCIGLIAVSIFSLSWFGLFTSLPRSCDDQIDEMTGIAVINSALARDSIPLIKVEIHCKRDSIRRPMARIDVSGLKKKRKGWYRVGDKIRIRRFKITNENRLFVTVRPARYFSVSNLTSRDRTLNRSALLLYVQSKARYYLSRFSYSIYKAAVTADRSSIDGELSKNIRWLGISHLFAISGLHVGLIYLWLLLFFKLVFFPFLRLAEKGTLLLVTDILCVIVIWLFLRMIGMPISAKRAFIMLFWLILLRHFFWWQPLWLILLGTAYFILLISPVAVGQLSFQLSFISVAGIIHILPILPQRQYQRTIPGKVMKYAVSTIIISGWLFLINFPLINILTPSFSVITALNNLAHIAFFSGVFLPIALLTAGMTVVSYPFGGFPFEYYLYMLLNILGKCWWI